MRELLSLSFIDNTLVCLCYNCPDTVGTIAYCGATYNNRTCDYCLVGFVVTGGCTKVIGCAEV